MFSKSYQWKWQIFKCIETLDIIQICLYSQEKMSSKLTFTQYCPTVQDKKLRH